MKIILFVLLGSSFITINARLIEKITDRTLTTETKTTGPSPPVRLTRDVYEEDSIIGFSKEDDVQSDEFLRTYNRRARHFFKSKPRTDVPSSAIRVLRQSHEKVDKSVKNITATPSVPPIKPKVTLVKKPIPKYNEMDYDDDFQMKISRSPVRVVDSGEHEDEDFNLDDYDFDVNHDEFIGRGKPLEPRTKQKETQERSQHPATKHETKYALPPKVKIQSKVVGPATHRLVSNKKERAAEIALKKVGEKYDYYDDSTTTTKAPEKEKARELDDEFNDDNEESKEFEGKLSSVRMIRSPWKINPYVDKLGEKTSSVMAKVLSILPMFPQMPNKNTDDENINGLAMDSWLTRS